MAVTAVQSAEYFVDAESGKDNNSGLSVAEAWCSVGQVNRADLKPGDTVRFKAGCTWRESLVCRSGAEGNPITYTRYGEGDKPTLLSSVDLASPECWVSEGDNIWKTRNDSIIGSEPFSTFASGGWSLHCDGKGSAAVTVTVNERKEKVYNLKCRRKGEKSTNIQLNNVRIPLQPEQVIRYRFRAKALKPFSIKSMTLMKSHKPWSRYGNVLKCSADIGTEWTEHEVVFQTTVKEPVTDGRLSFFIGDILEDGNVFSFISLGAELVEYKSLGLNADVGNIILIEKGKSKKIAGWKRWSLKDLTKQGDFYHDLSDNRLCFYSAKNPADTYSQIEAALKRGIVRLHNTSYVVVDGLTIAYTGAHGANGSNCRNGTIRNCNFLWIGGSLLFRHNGNPVRYGNGVEFWNGCENMTVENNYFENIYDTAMTNQGRGDGVVRNMTWRNNKIVRCEQSYEIWFSNPEMVVDGLFFTGNECIDSGFGWGHIQRPTAAGCHLLAYSLKCQLKDIRYEHNTFNNAKDAQIWFHNPRLKEIQINHNKYIQRCAAPQDAKLFRWYGSDKGGVTFDVYREATGNDQDSTLGN